MVNKPGDTEESTWSFANDVTNIEEPVTPMSLSGQGPEESSINTFETGNALQAEMETRRTPESCLERLRAKNREWHKKGLCMVLLIGVVTFLILDSIQFCIIPMLLADFLEWVEQNPTAGIFAFTAVFMLATVLLIPGAILTLGAGYVFANAFGMYKGVLLGSISTFIGAVAGSLASFLLGRYLLHDWVSRLSDKYEKFQALNAALNEKGIRIMVLLRLSPAIPYNIVNYLCGLTKLSVLEYTISLVALLPGAVLYVFLGASAGSLANTMESGKGSTSTIVVIVTSVVFGIAAIGLTSYYAKRELDKITERKRQTQLLSSTEVFTPEDSSDFEVPAAVALEAGQCSREMNERTDEEEKEQGVMKGNLSSESLTTL